MKLFFRVRPSRTSFSTAHLLHLGFSHREDQRGRESIGRVSGNLTVGIEGKQFMLFYRSIPPAESVVHAIRLSLFSPPTSHRLSFSQTSSQAALPPQLFFWSLERLVGREEILILQDQSPLSPLPKVFPGTLALFTIFWELRKHCGGREWGNSLSFL